MKRLLIYFSVLVGCLFVGLTTYYMLKNYEYITNTRASGEVIYLNKGETTDIKITHEKKDEDTVISHTFSNEGVASYNLETGVVTAISGGETVLKIFSNNESLPTFEYTINVGDGNENSGWFIRNAEELKTIGKKDKNGNNWELSATYELLEDISLEGEWTPIAGAVEYSNGDQKAFRLDYFTGTFRGNQHTIKNLSITKDQYTAGLFGAVGEFATITSINFDNVNLDGYFYYAGTVAGISDAASVEKIQVTNANIKIKPVKTLEFMYNGDGTPVDQNNIGGIVGTNRAYILNVDGEETINHSSMLMNSFSGLITVEAKEIVNTYYMIGGIVGCNLGGEIRNNKATINYVINSIIADDQDVTKAQVGGIIGTSYIHRNGEDIVYPIVMNNLAVMRADKATARMGGVIGQRATNADVHVEILRRISNNVYVYSGENPLTVNYDGCIAKSAEQLLSIATFDKWSISEAENANESASAWIMVSGTSAPEINFDGASDQCEFSNDIIELNNANFASYIEKMLDNTTKSVQKYWLSRHYKLVEDIDLSAIESLKVWTPISYRTTDYTFTGIFDGNGHKISNLVIKNLTENGEVINKAVGLFASIGNAGVVENLIISNVNIDYAQIGGAIAGVNYGTIQDCQVEAITIADAEVAGFVAGYNYGIIKTTKTQEEPAVEGEEATIEETKPLLQYTVLEDLEGQNSINSNVLNKNIYLGGITGFNKGTISGARIQSSFAIKGATATEGEYVKMLGGIAGYNGNVISSSSVENAQLADLSRTYIYIGGIAGLSNGTIEKSHAGLEEGGFSTTILSETNKGNQVVGGIVGQLSAGATITQSFVNGVIKGYYVGGVAGNLFGTVSETYVKGEISGEYVGGFAVNLSVSENQETAGYVHDCYIRATLAGVTESSRVAGLATYIIHPGKFERIVVSVKFAELGSKYYESYTDTRTWFYNGINTVIGTKLGTVYNIIIDETINKDKINKNGGAINFAGQSVYYVDTATLTGGETFYADKGFSLLEGGVWKMDIQAQPTLVNVELDNIKQNITIAEVPEADVDAPAVEGAPEQEGGEAA